MLFILNSLGNEWMKRRLKLLAILTEPQNVQKLFSFRPMQTTLMSDTCKQWLEEQRETEREPERGRREDTRAQPVCSECAYEECQVAAHSWLALWHCGTVAAGKQSVASHLDTCNNSIVWTSIKEDWWQATDRAGQRLLWSLYSEHTHTHTSTHTHRYLYSFVCWDRWKNDS